MALGFEGDLTFSVDGPGGSQRRDRPRGGRDAARPRGRPGRRLGRRAGLDAPPGRPLLAEVARLLHDEGAVLRGDRARTAWSPRVGAGIDSPVGRLLAGSRHVRLGRPAAVRPLARRPGAPHARPARARASSRWPSLAGPARCCRGPPPSLGSARDQPAARAPDADWRGLHPRLLRAAPGRVPASCSACPRSWPRAALLALRGPAAGAAALLVGGLLLGARAVRRAAPLRRLGLRRARGRPAAAPRRRSSGARRWCRTGACSTST